MKFFLKKKCLKKIQGGEMKNKNKIATRHTKKKEEK